METANIIYHYSVLVIAIVFFFMKWTATSAFFQFILNAVSKIGGLYCILYSGVQIFKYYGII